LPLEFPGHQLFRLKNILQDDINTSGRYLVKTVSILLISAAAIHLVALGLVHIKPQNSETDCSFAACISAAGCG